MKKIHAIALFFASSSAAIFSFSWEPGYWRPGMSQKTESQLLANNIRYLQNSRDYNTIISNNNNVCVICYEKNQMDTVIDQVAQKFPTIIFLKVNVNKFPLFKEELKTVPAILLFKSGNPVYFKEGNQTAQELIAVLKKYFKGMS